MQLATFFVPVPHGGAIKHTDGPIGMPLEASLLVQSELVHDLAPKISQLVLLEFDRVLGHVCGNSIAEVWRLIGLRRTTAAAAFVVTSLRDRRWLQPLLEVVDLHLVPLLLDVKSL